MRHVLLPILKDVYASKSRRQLVQYLTTAGVPKQSPNRESAPAFTNKSFLSLDEVMKATLVVSAKYLFEA